MDEWLKKYLEHEKKIKSTTQSLQSIINRTEVRNISALINNLTSSIKLPMEEIMEGYRKFQNMGEIFSNSINAHDMLNSFAKLNENTAKTIEKINGYSTRFGTALEGIHEPMTNLSELIRVQEKLSRTFDQSKYLKNFFTDFPSFSLDISRIDFPGLDSILKEVTNIKFEITGDRYLHVNREKYALEEIQKKIDRLLEKEDIDLNEKTLEYTINKFIKVVQKLKDKYLMPIILGIISSVIASFFFAKLYTEPSKVNYSNSKDKKDFIKKIKKNDFPNSVHLENFRYVSVYTLNVRVKNERRSIKIGELHLGYSLLLLDRRKDWSLVYYKNKEVEIKGWVFSRYLKKFR